MNAIAPKHHGMPAAVVEQIEAMSDILRAGGQIPAGDGKVLQGIKVNFDTEHFLHNGIYGRTIHMPDGFLLIGSLIRVPTIMAISGDMSLYDGTEWRRMQGYNVLVCSAHRRGMGFAHELTHITMLFSTSAKNVKQAEQEFTHEWESLMPAREV